MIPVLAALSLDQGDEVFSYLHNITILTYINIACYMYLYNPISNIYHVDVLVSKVCLSNYTNGGGLRPLHIPQHLASCLVALIFR